MCGAAEVTCEFFDVQGHNLAAPRTNAREQSFIPGFFKIDTEDRCVTNVCGRCDGYIMLVLLMAACLYQSKVTLTYTNAFVVWEFSATDLYLNDIMSVGRSKSAIACTLCLNDVIILPALATRTKYSCLSLDNDRESEIVNSGWFTICRDATIDWYGIASLLPPSMC